MNMPRIIQETIKGQIVRVRKCRDNPERWRAQLIERFVWSWQTRACRKSILGTYPTPEAAFEAASDCLSMRGKRKLCTPEDIEQVRQQRKHARN